MLQLLVNEICCKCKGCFVLSRAADVTCAAFVSSEL